MAPSGKSAKARILVLHTPDAPELKVLEKLPEGATVLGIGRTLKDLEGISPMLRSPPHAFLPDHDLNLTEDTFPICTGKRLSELCYGQGVLLAEDADNLSSSMIWLQD